MKYLPPFNSTPSIENPEPSYFDGNPQAGQKGAVPPGKAIEHPMREILAVIQAAGLVPSDSDLTQLLQAIQLIAAGIGGDPNSFGYNPVFPEIISNGGVMSLSSSVGSVVLAAAQQFIHRGGTLQNTNDFNLAARTKSTVANKTYHYRWRFNAGSPVLELKDLADLAYNPGVLPETHWSFDSTYDDMLIARVVTDAGNTPSVTALFNRNRMLHDETKNGTPIMVGTGTGNDGGQYSESFTLNWARSPLATVTGFVGQATVPLIQGWANKLLAKTVTRYGVNATIQTDYDRALFGVTFFGSMTLQAQL
ncbi:hypothetical protein SAMN04488498_104328 [Mesorhizobium albiziae]|uniref:Uncharacterized protein n=1 Tax=Neomesorhizobium albiziae TaxID=335020 RepID=A0A1I3YBK3_9HYPH|nr:hypothetical protein [Mesorhizobium albiziae]GLS29967.1 hypothetical protein GCM10007937_16750 [Mesorhizobium albiziae]SFK29185.1 hypothetical protein SAMN04488498_104328 [Mesorhizobium albiziae]